eukprot:1590150-Pyramimonas_sp.AAC.1
MDHDKVVHVLKPEHYFTLYVWRRSLCGSIAAINHVFENPITYLTEESRQEGAGTTSGPRSRSRSTPSPRCSTASTCTRTRARTVLTVG